MPILTEWGRDVPVRELRRRLQQSGGHRVARSGSIIAVTDTLTVTVHRDVVDLENQVTGDTVSMNPAELKEVIEGLAWAAGKVAVEAARGASPEWKDRWEL
jgi:hypothetical protein